MNIERIETILNRYYPPMAGSGHRPCAESLMKEVNKSNAELEMRLRILIKEEILYDKSKEGKQG